MVGIKVGIKVGIAEFWHENWGLNNNTSSILQLWYRSVDFQCTLGFVRNKKKKQKKTLWPLFMDGVQLPQGYSHFEEAVYFFPFSSQKFLVLILSTSEG